MSNKSREPAGEEAAQKLITVTEAAEISGFTPSHIRLLMRRGIIWGIKLGRDWLTTEAVIQEYLATERRPGRRSKPNVDAGADKTGP